MAKTVSFNLAMTAKDTTNVSGNSNIFGYAEKVLSDVAISNGDSMNLTIASGVSARNIFPSGLAAATEVVVCGFIQYDSNEPIATQTMDINPDAVGAVTVGDFFSFSIDTSLTLTTNAANSATVQLFWYVKA